MLVGLTSSELEAFATAPAGSVQKASRPSLAAALAAGAGGHHGLGDDDRRARCRHRRPPPAASAASIAGRSGRSRRPGVEGDVRHLVGPRGAGRTPVAVVCAGPKAILDVPATSNTSRPGACRSSRSARRTCPASTPARRASAPHSRPGHRGRSRVVRAHSAGLGGGILVCVRRRPTSRSPTTSPARRSTGDADAAGISGGPALTPWLLARIATLTDGASVRANTALIVNDARVAGEIARLAAARLRASRRTNVAAPCSPCRPSGR